MSGKGRKQAGQGRLGAPTGQACHEQVTDRRPGRGEHLAVVQHAQWHEPRRLALGHAFSGRQQTRLAHARDPHLHVLVARDPGFGFGLQAVGENRREIDQDRLI